MVKTRGHGQGAIESIHHDGYMGWARGRLRYRGDPYLTDGIGAGAAALADLARRDRDAKRDHQHDHAGRPARGARHPR